jgi:carboxyl-terminal processing protease
MDNAHDQPQETIAHSAQTAQDAGQLNLLSIQGPHRTMLDQIYQDAKAETGHHGRSDGASGQVCGASAEYMKYVETAARRMYDPESLGNIAALDHKYDCQIHSGKDVIGFADQAMAVSGDRFNHVMAGSEINSFNRSSAGGYTGIGLIVENAKSPAAQGGSVLVDHPVPGRAAEAAGLKAGDAIMAVNGKDTSHMTMTQVTDILTGGAPGSKVDIVVDRAGQKIERQIERQTIESPVVHDSDLGNGVAYIEIDNFASKKTVSELAAAIDRHKDARGFVVDVRNNPGGYIDQSLQSAALFVPHGTLMTTRERVDSDPANPQYINKTYGLDQNSMTIDLTTSDGKKLPTGHDVRAPYMIAGRPVVVLTNGESASAAEIFTGALHDTAGDATLGTTTFGKGIGQDYVKNMPDGGWLKVTSLRYLTPSGKWPGDASSNRIGLAPDYYSQNLAGAPIGTAQDKQLASAYNYLRARIK